ESFELDLVRLLQNERTSHHARALGSIDTFRFEEAAVRAAAFDALRADDWEGPLAFAVERTPESCFWVKRSTSLQRTWEIVKKAAETGLLFAQTADALERCTSIEEATAQYVKKLAPVDRAMRLFE